MSQSTTPTQRLLNLEANEFKKINGTSSQFLKADGSIDTNTYAATSYVTLQNVLDTGITWTSSDGFGNFTIDPDNGDGYISYTHSDEGWGYILNAEEGLLLSSGDGNHSYWLSDGSFRWVQSGSTTYSLDVERNTLTADRNINFPDASGTIALTSDLIFEAGTGSNSIKPINGSNVASGSYSTVSGGWSNIASGDQSIVSGGTGHTASGYYSTVGGGSGNTTSAYYSTVSGGYFNTASAYYSTVSGGRNNDAEGECATIGGGHSNSAYYYATVGGGRSNSASYYYSTISGGRNNTALNNYSTVIGGYLNITSGTYSTVIGGRNNKATSYGETVGGIFATEVTANSAIAFNSADRLFTIGNGTATNARSDAFTILKNGLAELPSVTNTLITAGSNKSIITKEYFDANSSTVLFEAGTGSNSIQPINGNNTASGYSGGATVSGGDSNEATSNYTTISGGYTNYASQDYATVGGGNNNTASGYNSAISGGYINTASGYSSTIGGGKQNTASGGYSTVSGGNSNEASGNYTTIGGGRSNTSSANYTTVSGGYENTASAYYSTVSGGYENTASDYSSTISGGRANTASAHYSTVSGGYENTASGGHSTVSGGEANIASRERSTIIGGYLNIASGSFSTIIGGRNNTAPSYGEIVGGFYATEVTANSDTAFNAADRLFTIGNGTATNARSDAFTILKNGDTTVNGTLKIKSSLLSYQENTDVDSAATEDVASFSSTDYDAGFFDYVIKSGTNIRVGTVIAAHDGTNVEFTETSTNDLGDTSGVTFNVIKSGSDIKLQATTDTDNWEIKTLVRTL